MEIPTPGKTVFILKRVPGADGFQDDMTYLSF